MRPSGLIRWVSTPNSVTPNWPTIISTPLGKFPLSLTSYNGSIQQAIHLVHSFFSLRKLNLHFKDHDTLNTCTFFISLLDNNENFHLIPNINFQREINKSKLHAIIILYFSKVWSNMSFHLSSLKKKSFHLSINNYK